jgi:hypothetical protein
MLGLICAGPFAVSGFNAATERRLPWFTERISGYGLVRGTFQ